MGIGKQITVEVAYAGVERQQIICVRVAEGVTVEEVILLSGILVIFPEIDLARQKVGVFSQQKKLTDLVREGDRVEIYRGLVMDPKEARRKRVGRGR